MGSQLDKGDLSYDVGSAHVVMLLSELIAQYHVVLVLSELIM